MKHQASTLEGEMLDAAVALAEGRLVTEADEHPSQPGYYWKTRAEWGEQIVRWYACEGDDADGPETDEEGGWEPLSHCGNPSSNWCAGGPIIERERIGVTWPESEATAGYEWHANIAKPEESFNAYGPTPLIAAMRAYVASRLGDTVELP